MSSGLSAIRLRRLHDVMAGHVEHGEVPGLVTCVCRRGEVHVDAIGTTAAGGRTPMKRDTLFRITSMTKPVTATAAMILVEECTLRLDETRGWGFGVAVVTHRDDLSATPGRYFWDGGYGTSWASDPKEDLIGLLMTQRMGFPTLSKPYRDFWTGAYQAIDD
jgi:CubicO group peptidase (beta-lactamase class C family)